MRRIPLSARVVALGVLLIAAAGVAFAVRSPSPSSSPSQAARPFPAEASPAPAGEAGGDEAGTGDDLAAQAIAVVPKEKIQSIDEPRFLPVGRVKDLHPKEPVIAVEIEGDARAYPVRILMFHEIVNDVVGGVPVAVTYCPLCNTGVAFERPTVDGDLLDFGVSGRLLHSNLVMYDRQTESLWPQAMGEAIHGPLEGSRLELVAAQILAWRDWRAAHPDGRVLETPLNVFLSTKAGGEPPYGTNPYHYYDKRPAYLFAGEPDPRLPVKARVLGVVVGEERLAFPYRELRDRSLDGWAAVERRVGGRPVAVFWKQGTLSALDTPLIAESRDVGSVGAFRPRADGRRLHFEVGPGGIVDRETGSTWDVLGRAVDGPLAGTQLEPVIAIDSFWFDWAAFHPDTSIFGLEG